MAKVQWKQVSDTQYTCNVSAMHVEQNKDMPNGKPFPFKDAAKDDEGWAWEEDGITYRVFNA